MNTKHKPLILIVEDDINSHQLYRDVFEKNGFAVTLRENADGDFINDVINISPDIISMDLMLGGLDIKQDGYGAIKELKAEARTNKIPVFVMSNFFEDNRVQLAKEVGAVDYINLTGQTIKNIPSHFLRYLEDPKHYKHSHPLFKELAKSSWRQFFSN